jgi:transcriptional regulator with XRE-family HTH domain
MASNSIKEADFTKLTQLEVAKMLGVNPATIRNWEMNANEEIGPFPKSKEGYLWSACLLWYVKYQALTKYKDLMMPKGATTLEDEKKRKEAALASMAELELAERQGKMVGAKDVERKWTDVVLKIRSKLLCLPSRLSTIIRDGSTSVEKQEVIEEEIIEVLKELSEDK